MGSAFRESELGYRVVTSWIDEVKLCVCIPSHTVSPRHFRCEFQKR